MLWGRKREREADLDHELRCDLELEAEEQREKGLSPDQAKYAARRAFGNTSLIKEETRQVWEWYFWSACFRSARFPLRLLRG